jgi:hypothetical protein
VSPPSDTIPSTGCDARRPGTRFPDLHGNWVPAHVLPVAG